MNTELSDNAFQKAINDYDMAHSFSARNLILTKDMGDDGVEKKSLKLNFNRNHLTKQISDLLGFTGKRNFSIYKINGELHILYKDLLFTYDNYVVSFIH